MQLLSKLSQKKIQKIRESGLFCCIKINSDFDYVWDIELVLYNDTDHDFKIKSICHEDLNKVVDDIYESAIEHMGD